MDFKRFLTAAMGIGLFVLICLLIGPRINPISPRTSMFYVEAGDVARTIVASAISTSGKSGLPIAPHHLEFSSSDGPVEIFVTRFHLAEGTAEIDQMLRTTELLRNGGQPEGVIAQAHAVQGTIPLSRWPYGQVRYLVYLRPEATSTLTLTTKYAP